MILIACSISLRAEPSGGKPKKKVYLSFILHGNMNYDRYVKPTIWRDFPVIYDSLLYFMDENPDFKGQMQLSGQTFSSLKQARPKMLDHAMALRDKGQLNFTGTFYSEPVNINMDGETNFRCARLGTAIIENAVGKTDGFYLQERAYHAQLPWILKNSNVSWVPVVTGDNSAFPFKLIGMDGTEFVCVPYIRKRDIIQRIEEAENNALILIENDFEIPHAFTAPYNRVKEYAEGNKDVEVEWILVDEYIKTFGLKEERYIDHTAISRDIEDGTYSRWTADPLDIIVQDYTNKAMSAFRVATIVDALAKHVYNADMDLALQNSKVTMVHDPVPWNIETIHDYPEIEPNFLLKNGKVTQMSRAEHLLVWAVNSDSKGWYPLYERRRERINSFENSRLISEDIIHRGLEIMTENIKVDGYDKYYILFNGQPERSKEISIQVPYPFDVYDCSTGEKESSKVLSNGSDYTLSFITQLPGFGYKIVGLKRSVAVAVEHWESGSKIANEQLSIESRGDRVIITENGKEIELKMDDFKIKTLAELTSGLGDGEWRDAKPYGDLRVSVSKSSLYPKLRVERQLDWHVHMQQVFTLMPDRVVANYTFDVPHPTLIRKEGKALKDNWDPRGLTLQINSGIPGTVYYDIPFGMSQHTMEGLGYFCPLSHGIFQNENSGGYMIAMNTGEQAFYAHPENGEMGVFMGASTTSGPIRDVGMEIVNREKVLHEPAWYLEPFHGTYKHEFMIFPFKGSWQENFVPTVAKSYIEDVYLKEFFPQNSLSQLKMPTSRSFIQVSNPAVQISSMEMIGKKLNVRINDKSREDTRVKISINGKEKTVKLKASGIVDVTF
jgi:hypothetical protein